jgi:hypothetical protein
MNDQTTPQTLSQVPPHFHKDYRISEKDLIPNGDYVSVAPNYAASEGTKIHYLNGTDYREYIMLDGVWRVIPGQQSGVALDNLSVITFTGVTPFAVSGPDPILFVAWAGYSGDTPTSITYDGIPLTLINSTSVTTVGWRCWLYYLRGPNIGTHDINITTSGGHGDMAIAASYIRTNQVSQPDASATSGPTTTTHYTQSVTSVTDNCWAVMAGIFDSGLTLTPDSGTIIRKVTGSALYFCDSAVAKTPAGAITLGLNSASQQFTGVIAAFKPNN